MTESKCYNRFREPSIDKNSIHVQRRSKTFPLIGESSPHKYRRKVHNNSGISSLCRKQWHIPSWLRSTVERLRNGGSSIARQCVPWRILIAELHHLVLISGAACILELLRGRGERYAYRDSCAIRGSALLGDLRCMSSSRVATRLGIGSLTTKTKQCPHATCKPALHVQYCTRFHITGKRIASTAIVGSPGTSIYRLSAYGGLHSPGTEQEAQDIV